MVCCFDGVPVASICDLFGGADDGVLTGACANVSAG